MAWIQTRVNRDGAQSFRVGWRSAAGRKAKVHYSASFDTRAEADRYLAIVEGEHAQGKYSDPALARTAFEVYAEHWYDTLTVSPVTRAKYRSYLDARILPRWQGRQLGAITNADVRAWVAEMPLKPSSVRSVFAVFSSIMRRAAADGYLPRGSPAEKGLVPLPRDAEDRRQFLTLDEVQHLLDTCLAVSPADWPLVYVAVHTGMRQGELFGLSRRDVHDGYVDVHQSLKRTGNIGGTKTNRRRRVDIDDELKRVLHLQIDAHEHDLVFPAPAGGLMDVDNWRKRSWERIRVAAGYPHLHFHDLRHTHATHMLAAGMPAKDLAERLGHRSTNLTWDLYGHVVPGHQARGLAAYRAYVDRVTRGE